MITMVLQYSKQINKTEKRKIHKMHPRHHARGIPFELYKLHGVCLSVKNLDALDLKM